MGEKHMYIYIYICMISLGVNCVNVDRNLLKLTFATFSNLANLQCTDPAWHVWDVAERAILAIEVCFSCSHGHAISIQSHPGMVAFQPMF